MSKTPFELNKEISERIFESFIKPEDEESLIKFGRSLKDVESEENPSLSREEEEIAAKLPENYEL